MQRIPEAACRLVVNRLYLQAASVLERLANVSRTRRRRRFLRALAEDCRALHREGLGLYALPELDAAEPVVEMREAVAA